MNMKAYFITIGSLIVSCACLICSNIKQNQAIAELSGRCQDLEYQVEQLSNKKVSYTDDEEFMIQLYDIKCRISNTEVLIDELYDDIYDGKEDIRTSTEEW